MKRIVNIYSEQMQANQIQAFHHRLNENEKIVGLMSTPNTEVSLAVKGGTKLFFEGLPLNKSIHLAPKDSMISFCSNSNFIRGSIRQKTSTTKNTNLYLIIQ